MLSISVAKTELRLDYIGPMLCIDPCRFYKDVADESLTLNSPRYRKTLWMPFCNDSFAIYDKITTSYINRFLVVVLAEKGQQNPPPLP